MGTYVAIDIDADPGQMAQTVYDEIASNIPGWEEAPANLETFLVAALTRLMSEVAILGAQAAQAIFYEFGRTIVNVPPLLPTRAIGTTTWTMEDNAGYTIPAGTQLVLDASGSEQVGFLTMTEVVVPPGSTATAAGEVPIQSLVEGPEGNDLTGDGTLVSALPFVTSIVVVDSPEGGDDGETEEEYVARLTEEMGLLSRAPILIDDYPPFIRKIPGVYRAVAVDNWDGTDPDTLDHVLEVGYVAIDDDGEDVSAPIKALITADLDERTLSNITINAGAPTYTTIWVTTVVRCLPGYDPTAVDSAVTTAIQDYLDPARWGVPEFISPERNEADIGLAWRNANVLRYGELWSLVDRVSGVDYVETLFVDDATAPDAADVVNITLSGIVPLTRPATTGTGIAVTANAA